ncbi:hypothetical protein DSM112329_02862 [Paraconexibacter sp. AEG42_29]|uniref:DUF4376 domain-containing protein n=1 Tax=Paraconexibacter sp. AEG42_29 TaxID=2997339 RepID=A0AAU7AW96_9ACTN
MDSSNDIRGIQRIAEDPLILVFTTSDLSVPDPDTNVDVEVHDERGRWGATVFTLTNLATLFDKNARTGECANGTYYWSVDMVLVQAVSAAILRETIRDLRAQGEFTQAFSLLADEDDSQWAGVDF